MEMTWQLPNDETGVIESIKVSELGHVMIKFRIEDEEGGVRWVNHTVANIVDLCAQNKIYKKHWERPEGKIICNNANNETCQEI